MKEYHKTSIGGQALLEGILMRGPGKVAIVVRKENGELVEKLEPVITLGDRYPILKKPFIRGVVGIFESMKLGMSALTYSADVYAKDEVIGSKEQEKKEDRWSKLLGKHQENVEVGITMTFSLLMALLFFFFLPTWIANYFRTWIPNMIFLNLVEGLIRIGIFLVYITLISKSKDIFRVLQYHGAEHKSIHCYEHGEELTVENVRKYSRLHPRCGTSFVFTVILISMLILSFFGWPNPWMRMLIRILMLPIIAGVSYEINRFLGGSDGEWAKFMVKPGLWVQNIATVKEPEDDMIEVAIVALKSVIPQEEGLDNW